jgi:hypothetical protein
MGALPAYHANRRAGAGSPAITVARRAVVIVLVFPVLAILSIPLLAR